MTSIWLAFITGLTTGGLSCMAVQGGLLATTLAPNGKPTSGWDTARTIGTFLIAKLFVYALLGLLLGWLGTVVQLSGIVRATIRLAVAIFLIGTALRMLNVHPFFRVFALEPPKALTRWLRRFSKDGSHDAATPAFLGLLTVLIPCGVTQAMMATALTTASSLMGLAIMVAFTLGTMPVFFGLAFAATRLGHSLQRRFTAAAAILILGLGFYAFEGGLNLLGSPVSVAAFMENRATDTQDQVTSEPSTQPTEFRIRVSDERGYEPKNLTAPANTPITLTMETDGVYGCVGAVVFPSLKISTYLPTSGTETIEIPPQKKGTLRYTCAMGMYSARITFK